MESQPEDRHSSCCQTFRSCVDDWFELEDAKCFTIFLIFVIFFGIWDLFAKNSWDKVLLPRLILWKRRVCFTKIIDLTILQKTINLICWKHYFCFIFQTQSFDFNPKYKNVNRDIRKEIFSECFLSSFDGLICSIF